VCFSAGAGSVLLPDLLSSRCQRRRRSLLWDRLNRRQREISCEVRFGSEPVGLVARSSRARAHGGVIEQQAGAKPIPSSPVFFACRVSVSDRGHAPRAGPLTICRSLNGWWVFQRLRISRSYTSVAGCGGTSVFTRRGLRVKAIVGFGLHGSPRVATRGLWKRHSSSIYRSKLFHAEGRGGRNDIVCSLY
jgi:hypothetical protein